MTIHVRKTDKNIHFLRKIGEELYVYILAYDFGCSVFGKWFSDEHYNIWMNSERALLTEKNSEKIIAKFYSKSATILVPNDRSSSLENEVTYLDSEYFPEKYKSYFVGISHHKLVMA